MALIVVKLGGSLHRDPMLPQWLRLLCGMGRGKAVIVPGGGAFADLVREHQAHWGFNDLSAHNMAVLAMMQSALMMQAMAEGMMKGAGERPAEGGQPAASKAMVLAATPAAIRRSLRDDRVVIWLPRNWLRQQRDGMTHWGATSDSLAAALASSLGADRLVLVKSCEIQHGLDLQAQAALGVVDAEFCRVTSNARHAIDLLGRTELSRLRQLLQD
jgi:5-(aminomethyl)-3-furanmethanol phosphate kinase